MENDLAPERVLPLVCESGLGLPYHFHTSCSSTNDLAARWARAGAPEGTLVAANEQTAGRGRQGRVWHSPPGANLYMSLLLRPPRAPTEIPPLTLLAGAALASSLTAFGVTAKLKWPNDLLLPTPGGLRKAAGILTEMSSEQDRVRHVVVGVGVNVNLDDLPRELADRATSLKRVTGRSLDRGTVLGGFVQAFAALYQHFVRDGVAAAVAAWRPHAAFGLRCRVEDGEASFVGILRDVDDAGRLLVESPGGRVRAILSGDVVVLAHAQADGAQADGAQADGAQADGAQADGAQADGC